MRTAWLVLCWALWAASAPTAAADAGCAQAAHVAEQEAGLPPGLLAAIGVVESGRADAPPGPGNGWPWAINAGGIGYFPGSFAAAQDILAALRAAGWQPDVGCFQISLAWHPQAFGSVAEAFDPAANARAAARYLVELHARTGSWAEAVALYHSASPVLGQPYAGRVLALWGRSATSGPDDAAAPVGAVPVIEGMRIIVPAPPGTAPRQVSLAAPGKLTMQPTMTLPTVTAGWPRLAFRHIARARSE